MDRRRSQRVYSGAVNSEVVIQGDISAQGNINISTTSPPYYIQRVAVANTVLPSISYRRRTYCLSEYHRVSEYLWTITIDGSGRNQNATGSVGNNKPVSK